MESPVSQEGWTSKARNLEFVREGVCRGMRKCNCLATWPFQRPVVQNRVNRTDRLRRCREDYSATCETSPLGDESINDHDLLSL
eukprot:s6799_g2.t1